MTTAAPTVLPARRDPRRHRNRRRSAGRRMDPMRKVALAGGVLYLVTFAASIPQLKTFKHLIDDPSGFISTPGSNAAVLWGSLLEVITAAAGIGTAVVAVPGHPTGQPDGRHRLRHLARRRGRHDPASAW